MMQPCLIYLHAISLGPHGISLGLLGNAAQYKVCQARPKRRHAGWSVDRVASISLVSPTMYADLRRRRPQPRDHLTAGTKEMLQPCLLYLHLISLVLSMLPQPRDYLTAGMLCGAAASFAFAGAGKKKVRRPGCLETACSLAPACPRTATSCSPPDRATPLVPACPSWWLTVPWVGLGPGGRG